MIDTGYIREKILDLAVRGELVDQNPTEGNARDLVDEIKAEKEELIKAKKIRKEKALAEIREDEIPFEIPESWVWVRLDDIARYKKGPFGSSLKKSIFVPKNKDTIKVYEQKNAIQKDWQLGNYYITKNYYQEAMLSNTVNPGDIIVSCAGTIGECYILPEESEPGIINQALMRVKVYEQINKDYFLLAFQLILASPQAEGSGSAMKNIPPFKTLKNLLFPLPPLAEQERIVERIEEAFDLLDEIEKSQIDLVNLADQLKSKVLDIAIQGKLVHQNPAEGTAKDLLEQIEAEKAELIKQKKIKKEKPLAEIKEEEIPFEIPGSWVWVRLGKVISLKSGVDLPTTKFNYETNGIPYITGASNFDNGNIIVNRWTEFPTKIADPLDILITCKGTVGKISISQTECHIARQVMAIKNFSKVNNQYLVIVLEKYSDSLKKDAAGLIPGIVRDDIINLHLPLPPLEEQKRIVDKIEEIFAAIDTMIA